MPGPSSYGLRSLRSQYPDVFIQDNVAQNAEMEPFCNTTGQTVASYSVAFGENEIVESFYHNWMGSDSEKQNEK